MKVLYKYAVILICLGFYQSASAVVPWVGTATYPGEVTATGEFNTYDFGAGINLIIPDGMLEAGTTFVGYYQTMVDGHFLSGVGVDVPNLNIEGNSGDGSGFELTLVADFQGVYTSTSEFSVTGGNISLYSDQNPDYDFGNDGGFADGTEILSGTIDSGVGTILSTFGIGVSSFEGIFDNFEPGVFNPETIAGGSALFSIRTEASSGPTPIIDSVKAGTNSVLGVNATGGILAEADGSLQLVAVPIPSLTWLFGGFLLGVFAINKRRTVAMRNTISV